MAGIKKLWSKLIVASAMSPSSSMMASRAAARPPTMPITTIVMISTHSKVRTPSSSCHMRLRNRFMEKSLSVWLGCGVQAAERLGVGVVEAVLSEGTLGALAVTIEGGVQESGVAGLRLD